MRGFGRSFRFAITALLVSAIAWALLNQHRLAPSDLELVLGNLGSWAPAAFIALFALATTLMVPGSILGLAGGALFGPLWGALWNLSGATLGAIAAFLLARYIVRDWIARKAGERLKRALESAEAEGWRFVALMRLVPIVPFNVLNYALGSTRIPLSHYGVATFVCMAPGAAAYAWLGHAGRVAIQGDWNALRYGLLGLALLAIVMFVPRLVHRYKDRTWISAVKLRERLAVGKALVLDVREPDEFIGPIGHIPDALNIPVGQLQPRMHEIKERSRSPVVIVCRTDKRSAKAAGILRDNGVRGVLVLRGGMEQWNRERQSSVTVDLPTKRSSA